ncbi:hypothetical protein PXD56_17930 [Maribacter sp. SA7]|uniref:DoxX family protein n=1 Tax=Maribacter zhoushanensis TaxID=3030012 RepID=UPI0023EC6241|nr:MauE/DoxX family redox-associated membrane protein [Maribacter zhoushanensis]MDF4204853.1 hypothetical protein [Maribacter zhoushanensis]
MTYPWHLYVMGAIYIFAGIMHFIRPKVYLRIMPRYLPAHKTLVLLSGVAEVLLGMGLFFKETKDLSIYGIIAMLTVFLLVHFYMLSGKKASAGVPKWLLLLRLPIQFILMYWAFIYLKV